MQTENLKKDIKKYFTHRSHGFEDEFEIFFPSNIPPEDFLGYVEVNKGVMIGGGFWK